MSRLSGDAPQGLPTKGDLEREESGRILAAVLPLITTMTRGITQADVFAAADHLLAAGERPTVERIRSALGSGSPNTVIRYLDAWWADAGHRLKAKAALPDMPSPVAELATALWAQAIDAASQVAEGEVAQVRAELAAERAQIEAQQVARTAEVQHLADALSRAEQTVTAQATQLEAWRSRANDWDSERERMLAEAARLVAVSSQDRAALDALRDQHSRLQQHLEQERTAAADHIRTIEDRAHTNVDAARQEAKALKQQVAALQRAMSAQDTTISRERAVHAKALATAERDLAAARAKAQALDLSLIHI